MNWHDGFIFLAFTVGTITLLFYTAAIISDDIDEQLIKSIVISTIITVVFGFFVIVIK